MPEENNGKTGSDQRTVDVSESNAGGDRFAVVSFPSKSESSAANAVREASVRSSVTQDDIDPVNSAVKSAVEHCIETTLPPLTKEEIDSIMREAGLQPLSKEEIDAVTPKASIDEIKTDNSIDQQNSAARPDGSKPSGATADSEDEEDLEDDDLGMEQSLYDKAADRVIEQNGYIMTDDEIAEKEQELEVSIETGSDGESMAYTILPKLKLGDFINLVYDGDQQKFLDAYRDDLIDMVRGELEEILLIGDQDSQCVIASVLSYYQKEFPSRYKKLLRRTKRTFADCGVSSSTKGVTLGNPNANGKSNVKKPKSDLKLGAFIKFGNQGSAASNDTRYDVKGATEVKQESTSTGEEKTENKAEDSDEENGCVGDDTFEIITHDENDDFFTSKMLFRWTDECYIGTNGLVNYEDGRRSLTDPFLIQRENGKIMVMHLGHDIQMKGLTRVFTLVSLREKSSGTSYDFSSVRLIASNPEPQIKSDSELDTGTKADDGSDVDVAPAQQEAPEPEESYASEVKDDSKNETQNPMPLNP